MLAKGLSRKEKREKATLRVQQEETSRKRIGELLAAAELLRSLSDRFAAAAINHDLEIPDPEPPATENVDDVTGRYRSYLKRKEAA